MARDGRGIRLHERGADTVQAQAWDPKRQTYKTRTFRGASAFNDAEQWAKQEHARLVLGQTVTGRSPIDDALESYEADLKRRDLVEPYRVEIMRILRHAVANGVRDLLHPRVKDQAREWLTGLRTVHPLRANRKLSPRTLNRHLDTLVSFANWCVGEDKIPYNPFLGIKRVEEEDKIKAVFTVEECSKLTAPHRIIAESYGLVMALQLYAGLRTGEALHMRWEWIDFKAMTLSVRQWKDIPGAVPHWRLKRRKERVIPLQGELAALLQPLASVPLKGWICSDRHRMGTTKRQGDWLDAWCKLCGVDPLDRTPHSTRHSWIAMMLASGENSMQVKDWAGHRDLETTEKYARSQGLYRESTRTWQRGCLTFRTEAKVALAQ